MSFFFFSLFFLLLLPVMFVSRQRFASHEIVVLPKGFYRVSKPLVVRASATQSQSGGNSSTGYRALVGVGRTISFIVPTDNFCCGPLVTASSTSNEQQVAFVQRMRLALARHFYSAFRGAFGHLHLLLHVLLWSNIGTFFFFFLYRSHLPLC